MKKTCMQAAVLLFVMVLGISGAENLVFNPEFHLGTTGYSITRYQHAERNPELKYFPLTTIDEAGEKLLKIQDPLGDNWLVTSKEFLLNKNSRYRLSGDFRSDGAPKNITLRVMTAFDTGWYTLGESAVQTRNEWKSISKDFSTRDKDDLFFHIEIVGHGAKGTDVFVRNLKLEKLDVPTQETLRIHAAFVPEKELYVADNGKVTVNAALKLWNPSSKPCEEALKLSVFDDYFKTSVYQKNVNISLSGGESKDLRFEIPVSAFGGYRMTVTGKNLYTHEGFFPVMGRYIPCPVNLMRNFVFALNDGPAYHKFEENAFEAYNAPWAERFRRLAAIGCRLLRDHDSGLEAVSWRMLEPEAGKLDPRYFNHFKKILDENHIELMPVLGRSHFIKVPWQRTMVGFPEWIIPRLTHVKNDPPTVMSSARGKVWLCSTEDWRHYCTIVAKLLRGKVQVCEIINEPNLFLTPEVYDAYLRSAREIFKQYAPEIKLIGFSASSDHWTKVDSWLMKSFRLGTLDAADIFSFHPYGSPQLSSKEPADENIAFFRKLLEQSGQGSMPIWNSELYYLSPKEAGETHNFYMPDALVRRTLVDLGEGCGQSILIHAGSLWKRMLTPNQLQGEPAHEMIPSENAVAANAFARLLEGAVPVKKYRFPLNTICYLFRRNGALSAAIWNELNNQDLKYDLSPFKVLDLYGNEVKEPKLGIAPLYLFPKNGEEDFLKRLESFQVEPRVPVRASTLARQCGNQLFFALSNLAEKTVRTEYRLGDLSGETELKNGECRTVSLRNIGGSRENRQDSLHLHSDGVNSTQSMKIYVNRSMIAAEKQIVHIQSPDGKLSADIQMHFSENGSKFNYRIVVSDTSNSGPLGKREAWETDCVELFCDPDPLNLSGDHPERYGKQVFRLFWMPRNGPWKNLKGMNFKFDENQHSGIHSINDKTYTVSGFFRVKNKAAGFAVKINDAENGESKAVRQAVWGDGELHVNRCLFPVIFAEGVAEKKNPSDFWNRTELFKVPEFESTDAKYPDSKVEGVQGITYSGLPLNGNPTRVFAYLGFPEGPVPPGGFPAVVLVHGGGGRAFSKYVKIWNQRGYAAIAMDLYGKRSSADGTKSLDLDGGANANWEHRCVANAIIGHSLLRAQKNVNKDKIGLIGVSRGGVFSTIISTLDDRLKFVVSVYGCGFSLDGDESIINYRRLKNNGMPWWEPGYFLHASKVPLYWVNGTNDVYFSIPAWQHSNVEAPTTVNRTLIIHLGHSHIGFELSPVFRIADSVLKNGVPLPKLGPMKVENGISSAEILNPGKGIRLAQLCYTKGAGPLSERLWLTTPAKIENNTISAIIPEGVTQYYLTAFDEKNSDGKWRSSGSTDVNIVR